MAIDATDIAHSDQKLVETVENMDCGYLSPPHQGSFDILARSHGNALKKSAVGEQ